ncbi:MAG: hypothetical protein ACRC2T_07200 [Thermoguttaceae bacterium]
MKKYLLCLIILCFSFIFGPKNLPAQLGPVEKENFFVVVDVQIGKEIFRADGAVFYRFAPKDNLICFSQLDDLQKDGDTDSVSLKLRNPADDTEQTLVSSPNDDKLWRACDFSPDCMTMITFNEPPFDCTPKFFSLPSFEQQFELEKMYGMQYVLDSEFLLHTGFQYDDVTLFSAKDGTEIWSVEGYFHGISNDETQVLLSPLRNNQIIISCLETKTGNELWRRECSGAQFFPGDDKILLQCCDKFGRETTNIFKYEEGNIGELLDTIKGIYCQISPTGKQIFYRHPTYENIYYLYDVESKKSKRVPKTGQLDTFSYSPNGSYYTHDNKAGDASYIYDAITGEEKQSDGYELSYGMITPDEKLYVTVAGEIKEIETGKVIFPGVPQKDDCVKIEFISFSEDGRYCVFGTGNYTISSISIAEEDEDE